jgi:hypothetical protein
MNRFSILVRGNATVGKAWEDAGFVCVSAGEQTERRPDALILPADMSGAAFQDMIGSVIPKLFVVMIRYSPPPSIAENYAIHLWRYKQVEITAGTMLETVLPEPPWPEYGQDWQKAIADTVYRHLLQDRFRETAEWCGHMSSVVRPF